MGKLFGFSWGADKPAGASGAIVRRDPRVLLPPRRPLDGREFEGGRMDRLAEHLPISYGHINERIRMTLPTLRARSRGLADNDDHARRFLNLLANNVIGPDGVSMQSLAMSQDGRSEDTGARQRIQDAWLEWASGPVTSDKQLDLHALARVWIKAVAMDGDGIIRFRTGRASGDPFWLSLQHIDGATLDVGANRAARKGSEAVIMGVQIGTAHQRTHYWFRDYATDIGSMNGFDARHTVIAAESILHSYLSEYPEQVRGLPWMRTAIRRLGHLHRYEEAELAAANEAANKIAALKYDDPDAIFGETGELAEELSPVATEPLSIPSLPMGTELQTFDPTHPTAAFDPFVKAILRDISAGLGVAYHSLSNDLSGANYSSLRQGHLDERDTWRVLQSWAVKSFYRPIFERWLVMALTSEQLRLPMNQIARWRRVKWRPRGWAWVDPAKEAAGNREQIAMMVKSRQDIAAETGRDWEETIRELAREDEVLKAAGLGASEAPLSSAPAPREDEEAPDDV